MCACSAVKLRRKECLHVGHERRPGRLVGAIVRAAAAAGLAAVADAREVAHRQAEGVEAVMGAGIDMRLQEIAAGRDPVEQGLALGVQSSSAPMATIVGCGTVSLGPSGSARAQSG